MSTLTSVFVGVPQSRYAAFAILFAMLFVSLTILVGKEPIPMSQKFGFVLLVFLISLPSLLMSLFQLTCLVTGAGFKNQRWWCSLYAWVLSAMMIFYAVLLVIAGVLSLTAKKVDVPSEPAVDMKQANKLVEKFFNDAEEDPSAKPMGSIASPVIPPMEPAAEPALPPLDDTFKGFKGVQTEMNAPVPVAVPVPADAASDKYSALHEGFVVGSAASPASKK